MLFEVPSNLDCVINVASVTHLSPFRYPGGKTWLVPRVIRWLKSKKHITDFIEPFAGGAIVGLTVADLKLADHILLVEKDEQVSAVWKTIFGGRSSWLADEIVDFDLTPEKVESRLKQRPHSTEELAFQTILKNRTFHGGILAPGSSMLKHGENGNGIRSRWYPQTLRKRILRIADFADRVTILQNDGLAVIQQRASLQSAAFFIDPPYSAAGKKAGKRLYVHSDLDHQELFRIVSEVAGDFLMTYDDADGVRSLAKKYGFEVRAVAMKNTHHAVMKELLIGKDLSWCD
jgi:DNA adenine methylase